MVQSLAAANRLGSLTIESDTAIDGIILVTMQIAANSTGACVHKEFFGAEWKVVQPTVSTQII